MSQIILFTIGIVVGILQRNLSRVIAPKLSVDKQKSFLRTEKNINRNDRSVRLAIGLLLLLIAIGFNVTLLFILAGYSLYEAISGWCGLYSIMGKSSCEIR